MKYKILLMGNNNTIIDDFFQNMETSFDCICCSMRFEDIANHIKYFGPDIVVYCLSNETRENISQFSFLRHRFEKKINIVIIGNPDECDEFTKIAVNIVDLILTKPITASNIEKSLLKFLSNKVEEEAETETAIKINQMKEAQQRATKEEQKKKRVLVIDDDILILKSVKEQLHDKYDVATALTGKLGLKFLETKSVDLIFLDYEMPGEKGPEVLAKIRQNPSLAQIPVFFLTGVTDKEKIQSALSLKPQGYMLKPINHIKLLKTVITYIG